MTDRSTEPNFKRGDVVKDLETAGLFWRVDKVYTIKDTQDLTASHPRGVQLYDVTLLDGKEDTPNGTVFGACTLSPLAYEVVVPDASEVQDYVLTQLVHKAKRAALDDSNDDEIQALQEALQEALRQLGRDDLNDYDPEDD